MFRGRRFSTRGRRRRDNGSVLSDQPSSSASAVPQKWGREADDEDDADEDDWAEFAREERIARIKRGEITQLEFNAELTT